MCCSGGVHSRRVSHCDGKSRRWMTFLIAHTSVLSRFFYLHSFPACRGRSSQMVLLQSATVTLPFHQYHFCLIRQPSDNITRERWASGAVGLGGDNKKCFSNKTTARESTVSCSNISPCRLSGFLYIHCVTALHSSRSFQLLNSSAISLSVSFIFHPPLPSCSSLILHIKMNANRQSERGK